MPPIREKLETYDAPRNIASAAVGGLYILCGLTGWFPFASMLLPLGGLALCFALITWADRSSSRVARRMESGDYLVRWQYTYADRLETHQLTPKAGNWESLPTPMYFATAAFIAAIPLVAAVSLKYSAGWVPFVFIIAGAICLAIFWAALRARPVRDPNQVVEQAVIGMEYLYWRKRLVRFCPNNETKSMRLRRVGNRIFFVAVSEYRSDGSVIYNQDWVPVPRGEEQKARRVMRAIRRNAAANARQAANGENSEATNASPRVSQP